jgi:hypothetical protein
VVSGKEYEYSFYSYDGFRGDDIFFYIVWGDGDVEEWLGPYVSGTEITLKHTWPSQNTYELKAKAKDIYGAESEWAKLQITMPKTKIYNPIIQLLIKMLERFFFFEKIIHLN